MSKGKKKKKDVDFQKVKLKIGRKLKRDSNETKAEFKSRKIIIREVKSFNSDPLTAITRHGDHISQHGKLTILNHFNSALSPELARTLTKPILDSLCKFIVDHAEPVRTATFKCLKSCYNQLKRQNSPTRDYILALKPYLDCAYTHVSTPISSDCQKFLEYLVNINDPHLFETLMAVILRRYDASDPSCSRSKLAVKLKHYHQRHEQRKFVEDILSENRIEPLVWSERNFCFDLDSYIHGLDSKQQGLDARRDVVLGLVQEEEPIVERFLSTVKD